MDGFRATGEASAYAELPPVLDALNDPVIASGEDGLIHYANAATERLLGWSPAALVGRPLITIVPERLRAAHEAGFHRYMTAHTSKIIGHPIRVPALHRDGSEIDVELTLSELPGPGPARVIAVLRDLRDRVELEKNLGEQRKILAQSAAVSVLANATSADEAMPRILEATAKALGWDVGLYWAPRPGLERIGISAAWSSDAPAAREFLAAGAPLTFAKGEGLAGKVWAACAPAWSRDVRYDARYTRKDLARRFGLRSAFLFPVYCARRTWGVLEFASTREEELDEDLRRTMTALGFQIGQFLERLANEDQLRRAVTDLVTSRERVREAEERLRLALDAAEVGTWDYRPETGVLLTDERFQRLYGVEAGAELTVKMMRRAIHPDDKRRVAEAVRRAFDAGTGGEYVIEYRTRGLDDGLERWVAMHGRTLFDERAQPVRFIGTGVDVTIARRALDRLRFLAELSRTFSSSLDYRSTLSELTALAVPRFADMCFVELASEDGGPDRGAMAHVDPEKARVARRLRRLYPPVSGHDWPVAQVFETGQPELISTVTDELLVRAARDEEHLRLLRRLELRSLMLVPLRSREGTVAVLGLAQSRSGRRFTAEDLGFADEVARRAAAAIENARLYERATRAIGVRDQFLSIASHELRTPLTALTLHLSALMRTAEAGRLADLPVDRLANRISMMHQQAGRLAALIDDLLDVSRMSSGRLELRRAVMELGALVREVAARLSPEAARAHAAISLDVQTAVTGDWDRSRLDQVVSNLISNAIKYAPGSPIEIRIGRRNHDAIVSVRDRGPGIPAAEQERIFEQFERAAPPTLAGLGLGLWIAKRIVEAHGGQIEVVSSPGQGATFEVSLPLGSMDSGAGPS